MVENIQDGIIACDADGRFSLINAAARRIHACDLESSKPEEWEGTRYDLFDVDGVAPLSVEDNPLYRALNGASVAGQELTIRPAGLPARRVVAQAVPLRDPQGAAMGAVATLHDVTAMRAAEEKSREATALYRAVFENTFQLCAILDPEGRVLAMNGAALAFRGVTPEQAIGRPFTATKPAGGSTAGQTTWTKRSRAPQSANSSGTRSTRPVPTVACTRSTSR